MGREAPASELAQAFTSYANQLLDRLQRLERRALTLELVVEILVQDGAAGFQLRRAVLRKLNRVEFEKHGFEGVGLAVCPPT